MGFAEVITIKVLLDYTPRAVILYYVHAVVA